MLHWTESDVEFFVPQLAAVLMSKGVPSRNVHVRLATPATLFFSFPAGMVRKRRRLTGTRGGASRVHTNDEARKDPRESY